MLGLLGTLGVVAQMATLSLGYSAQITMVIGLFACVAWIIHSIKQGDNWLLITNTIVAGFALWGLT